MRLLLAWEFLTILRLRPVKVVDSRQLAQAQAYFPLVGILLGLILVATDRLLSPHAPALLLGALLLVLLVILTGGLHLDGLGDTADGMLGGHSPEERRAIMKDPRLGSYGTLAIISVLLLKWSAITTLAEPWRTDILILAPALARWNLVLAIAATPYARPTGTWEEFHRQAWPLPLLIALVTATAVAVVTTGMVGLVLLGLGSLVTLGLARMLSHLIGGLTGDSYGAILEVTEMLIVVGGVGLARGG